MKTVLPGENEHFKPVFGVSRRPEDGLAVVQGAVFGRGQLLVHWYCVGSRDEVGKGHMKTEQQKACQMKTNNPP